MSNTSEIDFVRLIPELQAWNNGHGISVEAWIGCVGRSELAIGYGRLFWPEFVEHDGCVLFAGFSSDSFRAFMEQRDGNRRDVEIVMNHRHVSDYFSRAGGSATAEQLIYLGRLLRDIWQTKLAHDFPDRSFVVHFADGPFEDLNDYEVTFWQPSAADQASRLD
ncbi:MAG: hypothetical protein H7Z14_19960 [Anaerolineae bacterium]|nr:hypothetical protein [Phycisphaerae bacterium]